MFEPRPEIRTATRVFFIRSPDPTSPTHRQIGCSVLGNLYLCNESIAAILEQEEQGAAARSAMARTGRIRGRNRAFPILVTLGRILLVPVVIWAITAGEMRVAFGLFLAAGITDAADGYLAKRFGMRTELGAYLDPLADKTMLVSIYVALGIAEALPRWLVILVVSRDIMIVGAVILSWLVHRPIPLRPLLVSKLNTVAQIALASVVLAALGFGLNATIVIIALTALVAALTLISIIFYVVEWIRHMNIVVAGP